jgi:hypothetical protein
MSKQSQSAQTWLPEIVYEEGGSKIPYIHVPDGIDDPAVLFIFLSRQTGETEPGDDGEDVPIVEMDLRQYVDMSALKSRLPPAAYDQVRSVLGFLPLREAEERGRQITMGVRDEVQQRTDPERRRAEMQEHVDKRLREKGEA